METVTAKEIQADFMKSISVDVSIEDLEIVRKMGYIQLAPKELQDKFLGRKIIHTNRVNKLVSKYGLASGRLERFTGFIPQKNLIEISNFEKQYPYRNFHSVKRNFLRGVSTDWHVLEKESDYKEVRESYRSFDYWIIAPHQDMITDEDLKSNVLRDDPIVVASLITQSGYGGWNVIVTAWGDEANIEEFQNPLNN